MQSFINNYCYYGFMVGECDLALSVDEVGSSLLCSVCLIVIDKISKEAR